jgi:DNA-binding CsgD family transcriptional regulator/N-acetylneuraminic acid mutarotase
MAEAGESLSERELVVLERLADGSTNREIARDLSISHNTVKVHLRNIYTKLGVSTRTEASTVAIQKGLLPVPGVQEVEDQETKPPEALSELAVASESDELPTELPDSSSSRTPHWRLISIGLLLIVVLLIGALFGPQLTGRSNDPESEGLDGSPADGIEQPIDDSDWLVAQPLPRERTNMALVAVGLELFQIGGEVDAGVVNLVDIFETGSGRWRSAASKPTAVADANAAVLFGEIYVPGGRLADGQPTSVVEAYSPANNAWRPVSPLPRPVAGALSLVDNGRLYVIGGWDGETYAADGYVYSPISDEWAPLAPMEEARANATGGALSKGLYVVGGFNGVEELDSCEYYQPSEEEWKDCPAMLAPRSRAGGAVLGNDRLLVFGGGTDSDVLFGEVFDINSNSWEEFEMPMLDDATSWHSLGVTNVETRIYALGGQQGDDILTANYIYAPFIHRTFLPTVGGES